ncbi:MAG: DUF2177 family protein [Comamonadaceae bacterium]|nr:MAG: DUF2177 family protein [Comamonadaceae bacterium]
MGRYAVVYLATLVVVLVLDFLWLRVIAINWYQSGIGHLMAAKPNLWAAGAFYLLYPVGIVIFAALPAEGVWMRGLVLGALFGLFCYGTYDATNLAVLRDWPLGLTFLDVAWGMFVSACGATAGVLAARWLEN